MKDGTMSEKIIEECSQAHSMFHERREKVGQTHCMTTQQKNELCQSTEKIKDGYKPKYEQFN